MENHYTKMASIDVSAKIEKKNNLNYLSWAWAVDQLLRQDPNANWEYPEPKMWGDTVMVFCSVTCNGITRTAQLPVMDYKNKAVPNPDAFAVNTAMQRCLAKAIALHGLGLYIYAGEDMPETDLDVDSLIKDIQSSTDKAEATKKYQSAMTLCAKAKNTEAADKIKEAMKGWKPNE